MSWQVSWLGKCPDTAHKEPFQVEETGISSNHLTSVLFTQVSIIASYTVVLIVYIRIRPNEGTYPNKCKT